jgi:hypothetical protein
MQGTVFKPLALSVQIDDADLATQPPLRTLLLAWLQAQHAYVSTLSHEGAGVAPAPSLTLPRTAVLTLLGASALGLERCSFLLTWQSSSLAYKLFTVQPANADFSKLAVMSTSAVQFPVGNPIMAVDKWARDVFWKAPAHAKVPLAASQDLLPQGKGWLDSELRQALRIAMPYLSIVSQKFWKGAVVPPPGGILVSGGKGSGKSALLERCAAALAEHPSTLCHVSRMNCRDMAGDKTKKVCPSSLCYGASAPRMHAGRGNRPVLNCCFCFCVVGVTSRKETHQLKSIAPASCQGFCSWSVRHMQRQLMGTCLVHSKSCSACLHPHLLCSLAALPMPHDD